MQELYNVAANQILTVTEPARLQVIGQGQFRIPSWAGQKFRVDVEASTDLADWIPFEIVTNVSGTIQFNDAAAPTFPIRFYRVTGR